MMKDYTEPELAYSGLEGIYEVYQDLDELLIINT